jgi:UPF0755 protein
MRLVFLIILIHLIILIVIYQGIYLPKNFKLNKGKLFLVKKGENVFQIGENLEEKGLIKNRFFFDFYLIIKNKQRKLQAGAYFLNPSMSIKEICQKIISGRTAEVKITIPEGYTLSQIEKKTGLSFSSFKIKDFKNKFDFLESVPDSASLEGFLFPDTYFLSPDTQSREVAEIFLKNFSKKLNPELRAEIKKQKKTIFEIVIMASLLEKEVKTKREKALVSGILWKRLKNHIPLQVDASVSYITGKRTTRISRQDTKIDSPFNTYRYLGLPPGPICNPGLESILAALYPKNSEYWYYLSLPNGKTIFSKTLPEHNIKKTKYLK